MRSLKIKQEKFAKVYLETGNATEAAMQIYKPKNRATARSIGSENLTKPNIRAYLEEKACGAMETVFILSQKAKSEVVRLNASKDILDRAGFHIDKQRNLQANEVQSDLKDDNIFIHQEDEDLRLEFKERLQANIRARWKKR